MLCAGIILMLIGLITNRQNMVGIWKNRHDAISQIIFSVCGLMFCQFAYLSAIANSNAGTATVLQYLSPLFIMLFVCITKKRLPRFKETLCIILAVSGTFIIATGFKLTSIAITPKGLFWGVMSALSVVIYTIQPSRIIEKWGSITVVGYGMFIGGIVLSVAGRVWRYGCVLNGYGFLSLGCIIIIGTVAAFTLYLQGVKEVGPVRSSMLASVEPVTATLFSALWLGSSFSPADIVGFALILATVFILARKTD
jgi:drug/metabolite transporter (DMT)-like permease